jgi:hypothetical protein
MATQCGLAPNTLQTLQNRRLAVGDAVKNDRGGASFNQSDQGVAANVASTAGQTNTLHQPTAMSAF